MKFLENLPYSSLIIMALLLGLAPFFPQPHILEKAKMLFAGIPLSGLDVFDLFFHSFPLILIAVKLLLERKRSERDSD